MSRFLCRVTRPDGTEAEMSVEAEGVASAVDQIVGQHLHITSLVQVDAAPVLEEGLALQDRVSLFARGLADLLRLGIPLPQAVRSLAKDSASRGFARDLESVAASLDTGKSLADALRVHPRRFPPLFIHLIAAGEKTGRLPDLMPLLARQLNLRTLLLRRLFDALLYPAIAVLFACVLLLLCRAVMLDTLDTMLGIMAPGLLTRWASFMMSNLPLLLLGVASLFLVVLAVFTFGTVRFERVRALRDGLLCWIPLIGRFRKSAHLSAFFHSAGILLRGGVPMAQSIELSAELLDYSRGQKAVLRVREQCLGGTTLSEALTREDYFPRSVSWIVSSGEARSRLPEALLEASALYERDAEHTLAIINTVVPSLAIVCVAFGLAGTAIIGLYMPLFEIMRGLQ